jgi:hypothetical protein
MRKTVIAIVFVVIAGALLGWAQFTPTGGTGVPGQSTHQGPFGDGPGGDLAWQAKRLRALNADRQKSMVSDADKLLKLARQLDAEVASNSKDEMTPSELHKVAEIEKLARSVKSKMALSFSSGPQLQGPKLPGDDLDRP